MYKRQVFDKKEKTEIKKDKRENANAVAWRTMTLDFENVKMSKVVKTLEKYFEVKIEMDSSIQSCRIKGTYENYELENLLKIIEATLDLQYNVNEEKVTITGEGC